MEKLTLFYNKRTGSIKELCGGEQNMDWFGNEAEDYELIYDFIIVDFDSYIISNLEKFNVEEGQLKILPESVPDKYL